MSVQAITAAFAYEAPSSNAKLVLLALANYADEDGICYPSVKRLVAMTGLSERAVRYALQALVDGGAIDREQRRRENGTRTSDEYRLHIPAAQVAASQAARPAASQAARPAASDKRHVVRQQAARGAGLTTLEPSVEPKALPQTPVGQLAAELFQLQPAKFRRSTRPDIAKALDTALKRGGLWTDIRPAVAAYYADPERRRDEGRFAMGAKRLLELDRWRDFLPSPEPPAKPATPAEHARRLRHLADTGEWPDHWGERPRQAA